jgi:hypothetical protein
MGRSSAPKGSSVLTTLENECQGCVMHVAVRRPSLHRRTVIGTIGPFCESSGLSNKLGQWFAPKPSPPTGVQTKRSKSPAP